MATPTRLTLIQRLYPHAKLSPCTLARIAGTVPVLIVLFIIILAYLTAIPATLIPLHASHPLLSLALIVVFHYLFLSTLANYLLLIFLDPGTVPASWGTPQHTHERTYDQQLRYCRVCKIYKPDRAHHCSVCNKCIPKMDHHCVFINNCVGFHNHKFFLSFVTHGFLGCLFVTVVALPTFMEMIAVHTKATVSSTFSVATLLPSTWQGISMMGFICVSAFTFALLVFVCLHFYLVARGRTTIEMYELTDPMRAPQVALYDLGVRRNFRAVCGAVPICWFLPTRAYVDGDGLIYERKHDDVCTEV